MADELKASPENRYLAELSKALEWMAHPTVDGKEIKTRGLTIADLLPIESTGKVLGRLSRGEPLTTGAGGLGGTTRLQPDVRDFALDVAPFAGDVAKLAGKGVGALGKVAGEELNKRFLSGQMFPYGAPTANFVVKPKGGNWLNNSVEKSLEGLKSETRLGTPAQMLDFIERQLKNPDLGEEGKEVLRQQLPQYQKELAINNWVDKNLTNYVKNQMATPEDPVRKLAEQDITHMPANEINFATTFLPENLAVKRMRGGFSPSDLGTSNAAKGWERITDDLINVGTAGEHTRPLTPTEIRQGYQSTVTDNPWLTKLDPKTPVYYPENIDYLARDLGLTHIMDVLKEDITTGRLRPESLKNVSMEQAVRRTHEYDQELAKKMEDAKAKRVEGMTVHKEYPNGMKWVQLDQPGQFATESDAMGHSVRGYEPPEGHPDWIPESGDSGSLGYGHGGWEGIKSGRAKIYSLVDPKGNPHTTVETREGAHPIGYSFKGSSDAFPETFEYNRNFLENAPRITPEQHQAILNRAKEIHSSNPSSERMNAFQQASNEILGRLPEDITQIKGKGNRKPVETYLPYIQDFVKSGNWSDVRDLHNTDLTQIYPESDLAKSLAQKGMNVPSYATSEELNNLLKQAEVGSYRDSSRNTTYINDEHPDYRNDVPPVEGMKKGGKVRISDNPDVMQAEIMQRGFAGGGTVQSARDWLQERASQPSPEFHPIDTLMQNLQGVANLPERAYLGAKQLVTDPKTYFSNIKAPTPEELAMGFNPAGLEAGLGGMAERVGNMKAIEALFPNKTESMLTPAERTALTKYKKDLDVPAVMRREIFRTSGTGDIETPSLKMRAETPLSPDFLENKYVVPILWDTSGAGTDVSQIAGVPLTKGLRDATSTSVQKQGGRLYPLIDENVKQGVAGASMEGAASSKINNLNKYSELGPTVGVVSDMAEHGIDFSHHIAEPYIGMLNALRPSNEALKAFRDKVRATPVVNPNTKEETFPYTKFPGIDSPNIRDIIRYGTNEYSAGNIRKAIAEAGDTYAMQKLGFPRWSDIYNVMKMKDAQTGQSAKTILNVLPNAKLVTPDFEHGSYNTGMEGTYAGGLADVNGNIVGVPDTVLLKRLFDEKMAQGKTIPNIRSSLLKSHHGQLMTAEDVARLREYLGYDKPKKAKGGEVHKAGGGLAKSLLKGEMTNLNENSKDSTMDAFLNLVPDVTSRFAPAMAAALYTPNLNSGEDAELATRRAMPANIQSPAGFDPRGDMGLGNPKFNKGGKVKKTVHHLDGEEVHIVERKR